MVSIFNYNTLDVSLDKTNHSISVKLNRPNCNHAINFEMLFELETVLSWIANHIEIHAVHISSTGKGVFSCGYDIVELKKIDNDRLRKFHNRLRKITYSLFYLPQTIIFDLKQGASNIALEFSVGADIRLAHPKCKAQMNHLNMGLTPACGGIGLMSKIITRSTLSNWILSGNTIDANELIRSGFINSTYTNSNEIQILLNQIAAQAPVARIQAKRSLLEGLQRLFRNIDKYEDSISFASMITNDWKTWANANSAEDDERSDLYFTQAKELSTLIQREQSV